jgi:hypothetical protein
MHQPSRLVSLGMASGAVAAERGRRKSGDGRAGSGEAEAVGDIFTSIGFSLHIGERFYTARGESKGTAEIRCKARSNNHRRKPPWRLHGCTIYTLFWIRSRREGVESAQELYRFVVQVCRKLSASDASIFFFFLRHWVFKMRLGQLDSAQMDGSNRV